MSHSSALARLESDLRMANRAKGTIQQYLASIRRFEEMTGKTSDQTSQEEIRRWVEHLQGQPIGPERLRCHYSALAFLFRKTLGQPDKVAFISMPRKDAPLPVILTKAEVDRVLKSFTVAKYSVFFALIYAAGLRISEAIGLETQDIDSLRGVIHPSGDAAELLEVRAAHAAAAVLHPKGATPLPGHHPPGFAVRLGRRGHRQSGNPSYAKA
jgi:integrase/recombinase XerD